MIEDESAKLIAAADAIALELPPACMPGVLENRRLLQQHLDAIEDFLEEHPQL